jgi:cell division septation protein DedD
MFAKNLSKTRVIVAAPGKMVFMAEREHSIRLDRTEYMVVSAIVVLVAGLMFTLGVFVGAGFQGDAPHGHEVALKESAKEAVHLESSDHGRSPASVGEKDHASVVPGDRLLKAFMHSKQEALAEMLQDEGVAEDTPISVTDGAASQIESPKFAARNVASESQAKGQDNKAPTGSKAPTKAVHSLFERAPASENAFKPLFGDFTVYLASYVSEDEATAKVQGLRQSGINEAYVTSFNKGQERWYRVGVGSFRDKKFAEKKRLTLVKRGLASDARINKVEN